MGAARGVNGLEHVRLCDVKYCGGGIAVVVHGVWDQVNFRRVVPRKVIGLAADVGVVDGKLGWLLLKENLDDVNSNRFARVAQAGFVRIGEDRDLHRVLPSLVNWFSDAIVPG